MEQPPSLHSSAVRGRGGNSLHRSPLLDVLGALVARIELGEEADELGHVLLLLARRCVGEVSGQRVQDGPAVAAQFLAIRGAIVPERGVPLQGVERADAGSRDTCQTPRDPAIRPSLAQPRASLRTLRCVRIQDLKSTQARHGRIAGASSARAVAVSLRPAPRPRASVSRSSGLSGRAPPGRKDAKRPPLPKGPPCPLGAAMLLAQCQLGQRGLQSGRQLGLQASERAAARARLHDPAARAASGAGPGVEQAGPVEEEAWPGEEEAGLGAPEAGPGLPARDL